MKVFLNAIIVHLVLNIYVFWWGWKFIPKKGFRIFLSILFGVEFIIYMIGFIARTNLPDPILHSIGLIGTSWMVFILYTTGLLLIYDIVRFLFRKKEKVTSYMNRGLLKKSNYYLASICLVLVIMAWGSYRFWNPVVTKLDITIDKKVENMDSLKVVMVSDIHLGYLIDRNVLKHYVDRINEEQPDMILMVGDIIDHQLEPLKTQKMEEELLRLKAPLGVYATTGNHEYREDVDANVKWLREKAKIKVLRDSSIKIADSFYLIGREDDKDKTRESLTKIIEDDSVDKSHPIIVMNHEPHYLSQESENDIDIALYGHTHNGQLFPANILINMMYEVGYGYKKKDNTHCYVSSGLGLSGPQYRIGTLSEIVVLNLKFQ